MDRLEVQCDCTIPRYMDGFNVYTGKGDLIRLCCLAREIEKITGKQFVYEFDLPENEIQDWDANQEAQRVRREKEIALHDKRVAVKDEETVGKERPTPHVKRQPPAWAAAQIAKRTEAKT
jgi:hypothetical protein